MNNALQYEQLQAELKRSLRENNIETIDKALRSLVVMYPYAGHEPVLEALQTVAEQDMKVQALKCGAGLLLCCNPDAPLRAPLAEKILALATDVAKTPGLLAAAIEATQLVAIRSYGFDGNQLLDRAVKQWESLIKTMEGADKMQARSLSVQAQRALPESMNPLLSPSASVLERLSQPASPVSRRVSPQAALNGYRI